MPEPSDPTNINFNFKEIILKTYVHPGKELAQVGGILKMNSELGLSWRNDIHYLS